MGLPCLHSQPPIPRPLEVSTTFTHGTNFDTPQHAGDDAALRASSAQDDVDTDEDANSDVATGDGDRATAKASKYVDDGAEEGRGEGKGEEGGGGGRRVG